MTVVLVKQVEPHGMTRGYSEGWKFHSGFILTWTLDLFWRGLWIYSEKHSIPWWSLLDACADSGCLCGTGFWQHYVWIYSCNLVSPADAPPSFPGTLSEIRVHERHTLVNSIMERVKWDEMITVMSCCYISMSCHVMSWSAWVVFGLATLPFRMQVRFHDDIDGSSLARAIYASTGPLLFPLIQGFSHTHTLPRSSRFKSKQKHTKDSRLVIIFAPVVLHFLKNGLLYHLAPVSRNTWCPNKKRDSESPSK